MTHVPEVLSTVTGLPIDFEVPLAPKGVVSSTVEHFSAYEEMFIRKEIESLLAKGVIEKSTHEDEEFISPIFLTPKSDGSFRLILKFKASK